MMNLMPVISTMEAVTQEPGGDTAGGTHPRLDGDDDGADHNRRSGGVIRQDKR